MIGAVRLEPGDLTAMAAGLQSAVNGLREAFRAIGQARGRTARAPWRLVRSYLHRLVDHAAQRVQRRAERHRLQAMLRQQRHAMAAQRRMHT